MSERVPEGWVTENLESVSNIIMGQSPPSSSYNKQKEGLPFFQGKSDFGSHHPTVSLWCSEPIKVAPARSILISVRAPVGDVNVTQNRCCIGRGLAAISAISASQEYLYQLVIFSKIRFEILGQGSTFEAINGSELKSLEIRLPPLPEQQKIVSILTSVDEVIERTQSQINKLQDLKKGTMNELLTRGIGHTEFKDSPMGRIPKSWEVRLVKDLCDLTSGGTPDRSNQDFWNGNIPWIKTGEINYSLITNSEEYITEKALRNSSAKIIKSGAVLMAMYGQGITRGKVAILGIDATINQACLAIIPKANITKEFIYYFFVNQYEFLRSLVQEGTQKNLNAGIVKEVLISFPPLLEQQKITSILSSIDNNIKEKQDRFQRIEFLKKSLMQDLLSGRVRVQVN